MDEEGGVDVAVRSSEGMRIAVDTVGCFQIDYPRL